MSFVYGNESRVRQQQEYPGYHEWNVRRVRLTLSAGCGLRDASNVI